MISTSAYIDPSAKIGKNVTVYPFAFIDKNVEIGDDNVIMPYVSIMSGARIGKGNRFYQGAVIAAEPQDFCYKGEDTLARIGDNNVIRENAVITRGTFPNHDTVIGNGNFILQSVRIYHDALIHDHCIIGNASQVSGYCQVHDHAILASNVLMQGHARLGSYAMVQGGCRFSKDIPPYVLAAHEPTCFHSINTHLLEHNGFPEYMVNNIAHAYRIIFSGSKPIPEAIENIREQITHSPEIETIIDFIQGTKLGLIRGTDSMK